jgi:AraC family transcriptional activator of pobA
MHKEPIPTLKIDNLSGTGQTDLLIRRFSDYLEQHHQNLALPHRHNFYHLVFFTEGGGHHTIDFTNFEVRPNQIYFMIPGQVHSWAFDGPVDGYVVNFTDAFFNSFLHQTDYIEAFSFFSGIAPEGVVNLTSEIGEQARIIFKKALQQDSSKSHLYLDTLRVVLLELFLLIEQNAVGSLSERNPHYNYATLKNYQELIEKNFLTLRLPKEYAQLLAISPNYLNALCKEHLGIQAGELIRNRILLEAKRLLVNMEMSISQVAYALNFSDNSYFTKFFRKHTGITPEDFRKKNFSLITNYS